MLQSAASLTIWGINHMHDRLCQSPSLDFRATFQGREIVDEAVVPPIAVEQELERTHCPIISISVWE